MADYSQFLRQNPGLLASVQGRMGQDNPFPSTPAMAPGQVAPIPQSTPVTPQEPSALPLDMVHMTRNSRASNREVANTINDRMAMANEVGQSSLREGEAKAQGAQRMADEQGASAERANAFHMEAVDAVRNDRALQEQYRKQAEADLAKASEEPHGMEKYAPLIMGIVGAAAMAGGDQGLGQGMGALGQMIGQRAKEKAARAVTQFDGHRSLAKDAMQSSQNQLDSATKLMAQEHEVAARQLERIGQESSIPAYREQAMRLAAASRDQGLQLRQQFYSTMAAHQLSSEKAAGKSLAVLMQKDANGTITAPEKAMLLDLQAKATGIDATRLNAGRAAEEMEFKRKEDARQDQELEIKRAAAGLGGKGGKLSADQEKMVPVIAGAKDAYQRVSRLVAGKRPEDVDVPRFGVGGVTSYLPDMYIPKEHIQHSADVENLLGSVLRAESGGMIGPEEIKSKRKAYGLDSSDEAVRARGLQNLLNQVKALDYRGQLEPTELKTLRPKAK